MKSVLKVVGILLGLLAVAGFVVWLGWLRPASTDDVCDNVVSIIQKEAGKALPAAARTECVDRFSKRPWTMSGFEWARLTKCVRDAEDMRSMRACEADAGL